MKTRISCILFLAVCLSLVGSGFGEIVVENAEFEDTKVTINGYTYVIYPWICDNTGNYYDAWISYGYYPEEPQPQTPILYAEGNWVFQPLSATYEDGGVYVFSIDVSLWDTNDDWELFFYDATDGDHLTHLVSRASTDPREEPGPFGWAGWGRKSVGFTATAAEAGNQIGIGLSGGPWTIFDNASVDVPPEALNPDPFDGEIDVLVNKTLSWYTGRDPNHPSLPNPDITEHKVYMSSGSPSDPNLVYKASIPAIGNTGQYTPEEELERWALYCWRVDELIGADPNAITITGNVWKFRTAGTIPFFDETTPADAMVDVGTDVVFTATAFNPFTGSSEDLSFQWYKVKVGEPDEMLSDGAKYSGTQTASLTVLNVQEADNDEGRYYCVVTNAQN